MQAVNAVPAWVPASPQGPKILVVDDDAGIRHLLAQTLGARGFEVAIAANARELDEITGNHRFDLVILDIMMPGENGLSVCRRLAQQADAPKIVLLSALGGEDDRVLGLDLGACHYLAKPCSAREVVATLRAALRMDARVAPSAGRSYTFDGWRLDTDLHELIDPQGSLVPLTEGEFAILRVMVERNRRVLSRDQLLASARGPDSESFDRAVDVQVSRLRRKMGLASGEVIRTVRNEGYLFVPNVRRV